MGILCSVVAVSSTGKFLVVKGSDKAIIPNLWSCGIVESKTDEMVEDTLKKFYMSEFNADIDIIKLGEVAKRPAPIFMFTVDDAGEQDSWHHFTNGFYFIAVLRNPGQIMLSDTYTDYKLDTIDNIYKEIGQDLTVPDLYYTMSLASAVLNV